MNADLCRFALYTPRINKAAYAVYSARGGHLLTASFSEHWGGLYTANTNFESKLINTTVANSMSS